MAQQRTNKKPPTTKPVDTANDIRKVITAPVTVFRVTSDMLRYKVAVQAAENLVSPQRYEYYQQAKNWVLDAHLTAAWQQRKNLTLSRKFVVLNPDGKENEEKTKLIRTKWFRDFIDLALDSQLYGFTPIQFEDIIEVNGNDEFKCVDLIPRIYVKPEFHIVTQSYADLKGTDYLLPEWRQWVIVVGQPRDLGLLLKAAPLCIWKKNALNAWAEFIEKFGVPPRIGKTNVRDDVTRTNMEGMLRNMGQALWAVLDTDDELIPVELKNQDAFNVFDMMIQRCNSEMSKLFLGQTATMDEKSFVGSAEVQERVLNGYAEADEHFINGVNNYQLVPLLNANGFGFEGLSIAMQAEDQFTMEEKAKFDIDLLKTGAYKFTPEYLKEKYGTEVIEIDQEAETGNLNKKVNEVYE